MKIFRLISLQVLEKTREAVQVHNIPLKDGLIIQRENHNAKYQWIIEAYINHSKRSFFAHMKKEPDGIMIKAKISKESNEPALFVTEMISINDIGEHINVLFHGTIMDLRSQKKRQIVDDLLEKNLYGKKLLKHYEEFIQ